MNSQQDTELSARIRAMILEYAPDKPSDPGPATELVNDLAYDSLTLLELLAALADEFGFEVPNTVKPGDVRDLGSMEALVVSLTGRGPTT